MAGINYKNLKVLVVEDESYTRFITRTLLRQIGVQLIEEAANGREGLMKAMDWRPDLVLCDIHMEPVDGFEFIKKLRSHQDQDLRNTPVIFLTADSRRDNVMIAKQHAANGFLVKPISLIALKSRLDSVAAPVKA